MGVKDKRIDWIDCSKGIAILLVIFGHTITSSGTRLEQVLRGGIFSFHMPLFFILSCVTYNLSSGSKQFREKTKKAFRHLIIPALVLYGLRTLINIINNIATIEWSSYIVEKASTLVWGSGVNVTLPDRVIPAFGMMWFFVALFCGRTLFDYLHLKMNNIMFVVVICICTISGVILGSAQWLPLSFDVALAAMPFFWFGHYLKRVDISNKTALCGVVSFVVWESSLAFSYIIGNNYLELAGRRYPFFHCVT